MSLRLVDVKHRPEGHDIPAAKAAALLICSEDAVNSFRMA